MVNNTMRFLEIGRHNPHVATISAGLMLLGSVTMLGWLLHVPVMVTLVKGLLPMVFTTGMGFLLAGLALALGNSRRRSLLRFRRAIGAALVAACSLILLEHILDLRLWIDLAPIHTWYDYGNTRPGRMAPNTAIGFIVAGAAFYMSHRVHRRSEALAIVLLTFLLLAIGLTGLVGYLLDPELLFNWARSARMAVHTALGMIACAIGIWSSWSRSNWYTSEQFFKEGTKIRLLSAAIFTIATLTIGLSGFVLLQGSLEAAAKNQLAVIVSGRGNWFAAVTREAHRDTIAAASLSEMDAHSLALLNAPTELAAHSAAVQAGGALLHSGLLAWAVDDASGRVLAASDRFRAILPLTAPLDVDGAMVLAWDHDLFLRSRLPVVRDGQILGQLIIDHPLPQLRRLLFNTANLSSSAEIAVCAGRTADLACFPNTKNAQPFFVARRVPPTLPLPMERALKGQRDVIHAIDYQGNNVLAALGPLAPNLGMVAKQGTAHAYAGIRRSLQSGAPIILGVSLLGALILVSQLSPLVEKIYASERAAADAAAEMETVLHAAGDGIITLDDAGKIASVNPAACRIFGYDLQDMLGKSIGVLIPSAAREGESENAAGFFTGDLARLLGTPNALVQAVRIDGDPFPLEVSVNSIRLASRKLFVAIMRDITVRKEIEDKLSRMAQFDALTGLPNRALFLDRLATALARATRSSGVLALIFLDLDGFKAINDHFGHEGGDVLLQQVSERLLSMVRSSDTVARLAGDEFTIILENIAHPPRDGVLVAQKIVGAMREPFLIRGDAANVTVSVGLIIHDTRKGDISMAELLRQADEEMYAVKRQGKNGFKVADTVC